MSWPISLLVALLNAAFACAGAMFVASLGVSWYRITSREGASGFFVLGMGVVGVVAGAIVGLIVARIVAGTPTPTFLKGLGYAWGTSLALLLLITGFSWLAADFPPKLEGKLLEVEVEVLCPAAWGEPKLKRDAYPYVSLTADEGSRRQTVGNIDKTAGKMVDGRWKLTALVPLQTTSLGKSFGINLDDKQTQFLRPVSPIPSKPSRKDFAWSSWQSNTTDLQGKPVPEAEAFTVRYRVGFSTSAVRAEKAKQTKRAEEEKVEAAFSALTPDSPLAEWLKYVDWNEGTTRLQRASDAIKVRPNLVAELTEVLLSDDRDMAGRALVMVGRLYPPPPELAPALATVGDRIVAAIEAFKAKPVDDQIAEQEQDLDVFLGKWLSAACQMHEYSAVDQLPTIRRIHAATANTGEHYTLGGMHGTAAAYVGRWTGPGGPTPAQ